MTKIDEAVNYFWEVGEEGKGYRASYNAVKKKYGVKMAESVRRRIKKDAFTRGSMFNFEMYGTKSFFDLSKKYK